MCGNGATIGGKETIIATVPMTILKDLQMVRGVSGVAVLGEAVK